MSAIFISHSSKDNAVAEKIRAMLSEQGHRSVFLDFHPENGIPSGRNWEKELYLNLRACQAVIVVCSEHSAASQWCFAEITQARALGKHLFPVKVATCEIPQFLNDVQITDITVNHDDAYRRLLSGLKKAGLDPANAFEWDRTRAPYPGLLTFEEQDAAVYFGRDDAIQASTETLNRLQRFGGARLVLVLGASGSGKSSLVRAGVVPRLKRDPDRWLVLGPFRPLGRPLDQFSLVLADAFALFGVRRDWKEIREVLKTAVDQVSGPQVLDLVNDLRVASGRRDATVLLVVDQLEELLGRDVGESAGPLMRVWRTLLNDPGSPVLAVATLRSDFLAAFQGHEAVEGLSYEPLPLSPMALTDFVQVIEQPPRVAGVEVEAGLSQEMIKDAATDDALPLLAFTLRELWDRHGQNGRLTRDDYKRMGGLQGSLARAAETILPQRPLTPEEEVPLRQAFVAMVRLEEGRYVRKPVQWTDLPEAVHPLLERFVQARLLVARSDNGARVVEVAHEALFRVWHRLEAWLATDREFLLWRQRLQVQLENYGRLQGDRNALLQGRPLVEAGRWRSERSKELSASERDFIDLSARAARRKRQLRLGLAAAAVLGVVGAALLIVANMREAARQAQRAWAGSVVNSGISVDDPTLAATLLRELADYPEPQGGVRFARQVLGVPVSTAVLAGHEGIVFGLAFSPDGQRIASAGADGTTRIWRADGRDTPVILRGHDQAVLAVTFSPDGKQVATAGEDGTIRIWHASGVGEPVILRRDGVRTVTFTPDGRRIAAGGGGGTVNLWSIDGTGESILHRTDGLVLGLAFSPDGKQLAVALSRSVDSTAEVLQTDGSREPVVLRGHEGPVLAVAFSPDGKRVATGADDGTARIWAADGSGEPVILGGHEQRVYGVAFSPAGDRVATAAASADNVRNAFFRFGGMGRVWRADGEGPPILLRGHRNWLRAVAFSPDGQRLATASDDGTIRIWPGNPIQEAAILRGHKGAVRSVAFSSDGERLATGGFDDTVLIRRIAGTEEPVILRGHTGTIFDIAFSPDGRRVATASSDRTVRTWLADGTGEALVLRGHEGRVVAVAFSPDGQELASASLDGTARIWQVSGNGQPVIVRGHKGAVFGIAYSPSGRLMATCGEDGTARIFQRGGSGDPMILGGHGEGIRRIAFSPDSQYVATAGFDRTARIWRADGTGEPVILRGHEQAVDGLAFSPDGLTLATASSDGTVRLWRTDGVGEPAILSGHDDEVRAIAFSPKGHHVASAGDDGTARVWRVSWSTLIPFVSELTTMCLSVDDRRRFLGESSSTARDRYVRCERSYGRSRPGG